MLYEIHMIKNYAPTNLNRDNTGAPKTCVYGGVTRARISSQCLKRSWRMDPIFREEIGEENFGFRTRRLPELVRDKLIEMGTAEELADAVMDKIPEIFTTKKKGKTESGSESESESESDNTKKEEDNKPDKTAQIVFYSKEDIAAVADAVKPMLEKCRNKGDVKKLSAKEISAAVKGVNTRPITLDIALFGRMVTSDVFADVDASMKVAHAIGTHKVALESDLYTAMDDLMNGKDMKEKGAAMLDNTDYNASCYYMYTAIDTDELKKNLANTPDADVLVKKAIPALLRVMAFSSPSGKQNSFACYTLPSAILVDCKEKKSPISMANAYSAPVKASVQTDLVESSIRRLVDEADMITRNFKPQITKRIWFCVDKYDVKPASETEICTTFPDLVDAVSDTLG